MPKIFIKTGILLLALFACAQVSSAFNFSSLFKSINSVSSSFGGKVTQDKFPGVECNGNGVLVKVGNNSIPFYADDIKKRPTMGGQILGKADTVPNLSICKKKTGNSSVPIPVRKTTNYGVSNGLSI